MEKFLLLIGHREFNDGFYAVFTQDNRGGGIDIIFTIMAIQGNRAREDFLFIVQDGTN